MGDFPFLEWLTRVYEKRAEESHNWSDYLKAHGLATSAVARDCRDDRLRLVYGVEKSYYKGNHLQTYEEHQALTSRHKQLLHEYRNNTKKDFESLKAEEELFDINKICDARHLAHAEQFSSKVVSKSKICSDRFVQFSEGIIKSSVGLLSEIGYTAPCRFAVIGLGSVARGEATPYSDLEYAFIVESSSRSEYFGMLAVDTYFRIGNLGETPLKTFDIEELSCGTGDGKPTLSSTPVGFRIDGISERAGNIPTGGDGGLSLTFTVDEFIELYHRELMSPPAYRKEGGSTVILADKSHVLSSSVLIYTNEKEGSMVYEELVQARSEYEDKQAYCSTFAKVKRLNTLSCDINRYSFIPEFRDFGSPSNTGVEIKSDIFRFPTLLATNLKISFNLKMQKPWEVYHSLCELNILSVDNYRYLQIILALSISSIV